MSSASNLAGAARCFGGISIGEWYLPSMASAADPQLQQILSDHNSPRKAALRWSKFVCAGISRYDMVQNQD
jgi:hypothetical protein